MERGVDMKLSIIVPVYNVEKYLAECVDSLLAQTLDDFEIFLVDDGSKDSSGAIADGYARDYPEQIHCIHLDNGGQGRARNKALELAKGDFVGFIDSDDWITPDMYEKLYRKAIDEDADIAVCSWRHVFPDGQETTEPSRFQEHRLSAAGSACNKLFRRSLIGDVRFPEKTWYEDFYFSALLMIRARKIVYVDEPMYCYRMTQNSTMRNNNSSKNLDILHVLDLLREEMLPAGLKDEYEFFVINHVLLDSINRVSRQKAPDRSQTLTKLCAYVRERIPELDRCASYHAESRQRRIIMKLNYLGLYDLSRAILTVKSKLR